MKDVWKGIGIFLVIVLVIIGLSYGFGWIGVHQTSTIKKARQDAETEVFENSNAFTKAKKQEILRAYKEYNATDDEQEKKAIANILAMSLADFDEDKYITDIKLKAWVKKVKY